MFFISLSVFVMRIVLKIHKDLAPFIFFHSLNKNMITFIIIWWCILGILACRILIVANVPGSGIDTSSYYIIASYTMCAVLGLVLILLVLHVIDDKDFKLW